MPGYLRDALALADPRPWHGLGGAFDKLVVPDSAAWAFNKALELDSQYYPAISSLATLYERDGQPALALEYARKAYEGDRVTNSVAHRLARLETISGKPSESARLLPPIIESEPWNYSALFDLANTYRKMGREEEALQLFMRSDSVRRAMEHVELLERSVTAKSSDFRIRIQLAEEYRKQGRFEKAITQFQAALLMQPNNLGVQSNLATIYLQAGQETEAILRYQRILMQDPDHVPTLLNLAVLSLQKNDRDALEEYLSRATVLAPDHPGLARILEAIDQ